MSVVYSRQTIDAPNPIARFAHRRRIAGSLRLAQSLLPLGGTMLDYGCGEGRLLSMLSSHRPDAHFYGYEPYFAGESFAFTHLDSLASQPDHTIDLITAFEVLEHLSDDELQDFESNALRLLSPRGTLLISVPIIGGPPLLLKEMNRAILFRRRSDYTMGELLRASLLGKPAPRTTNIKGSHKGFDFRSVERRMEGRLPLKFRRVSPFAPLPWWLNSQVFFAFGLDATM